MKNPFRRKAVSGTPAVLEALASRQWDALPQLGGSNQIATAIREAFSTAQTAGYAWMYANSPAVRAVIDLIARNVAQLDLRLFEEIDETQREQRPDHPAAQSLEYPSGQQTPDQFVYAMVSDKLVFNNAYALKFRAPGAETVTLKPVPAQMVQVQGASLFDPEGYKVWTRDGQWLQFEPSDVLHWRGWSPLDPRLGLSPLETLRNVVAEDAALQTAIIELSKSGLMAPSWVYRPLDAPEWSNPARKGFEEDLANRMQRRNRTPPVMEEGMELRPFGVSPQDAQMLDVRKWALQQIATQYGVPLGMVGLGEARAAQPDLAQSEFYADTLPPVCESFTRQLKLSILQAEYGETNLCFEFNLDEKHMGDNRLAALTSATGRPVLTSNEGRSMINRPPVDGGDELVTPANVFVGANPKPSPAVMPIQDPNGPAQDGSHRELSPGEAPAKSLKIEMKADELHPRRKADMARQHRYIDEAQGMLERYYARQSRSLEKSKAVADGERWNRELADDLHKLMESIVEREGGIYTARLGGADFDVRQVANYMKATAEGVARAVNEVTQRDIEESGAEDALSRARGERASVLAASVGTRSTVFARTEAAKQSPHPERRQKTWMADTARHANLNGETVPLGEPFSGGFSPGGPANCRCSLTIF